ncbi:MAG: cupin domain-containing protein [Gaiella sp.]
MSDLTIKRLDECESIFDDWITRMRGELGGKAFGMQVFKMPPNFENHPEHNHAGVLADDGHEEVYTVLDGSAVLIADGQEHVLEPGVFARCGPSQVRKIVTRDEPVTLLAIGGPPGRGYVAAAWTEVGGPLPGA